MRLPLPARLLFFSLACIALMAATAAAGPLSGRVTGLGNPVPDAQVDAIDPVGGDAFTTFTNANGDYLLDLPDGRYDVRVTPTSGTLLQVTVPGVSVSGPTVLDITLPSPVTATLGGRVLDGAGLGLPDQQVQLIRQGGDLGPVVITDSVGQFQFNTDAGMYFVVINGGATTATQHAPRLYSIQTGLFQVSGNTQKDFQLPVKQITVTVETGGASPTPVANAGLSSSTAFSCELTIGGEPACGSSHYTFDPLAPPNVTTNGSGTGTLYLFPTPAADFTYTLIATPPDGSGLAPGHTSNVTFQNDASFTITLAAPTVLSGRLLDGIAIGLANQAVVLTLDGQEIGTGATTDEHGDFSFSVEPGSYTVGAFGDNQSFTAAAPQNYAINSAPLSIGDSQTLDFPLPVRRVDVHVQDSTLAPAPGVGLSTSEVLNCELLFGPAPACGASSYSYDGSPDLGVTDEDGNLTLWLFPTPGAPAPGSEGYRFFATPSPASGLPPTTVSNIVVSAGTPVTSVTITLAAAVAVTGTLKDRGNPDVPPGLPAGMPGQFVELVSEFAPPVGLFTGANGEFAFGAQPGWYRINAFGDNLNFAAAAPQSWTLSSNPFTVSGNLNLALAMPARRIVAHVQTSGGTPVANVGLSAFGPVNCTLAFGPLTACGVSQYFSNQSPPGFPPPATGVTDAAGNLALYLFDTPADDPGGEDPGKYSITATPMADSGFAPTTATGVTVDADATLVIVLAAAHAAPVTTLDISPNANPDGTYPSPVTITLTATVHPDFDLGQTLYEVDGGGLLVYSGPFEVAGFSSHTIRYLSVDSGGVAEVAKVFNFEIADAIPPTTTATVTPAANGAGWHRADVHVELNAVDNPGGSGVDHITYSISGAQATAATDVPGDNAAINITTEGISVITFFATDVAGNVEAAQTLTVRLDKTAPEVYSQWDPVTYDILFFGRDGGSGVPATPITPTVVNGPSGLQLRTYVVTDAAGNTLKVIAGVVVGNGSKSIDSSIICLKYNNGPTTAVAANVQSFRWKLNANTSLRELEESVLASPTHFTALFTMATNQTLITRVFPPPNVQVLLNGLVLLKLATSQGTLTIEF